MKPSTGPAPRPVPTGPGATTTTTSFSTFRSGTYNTGRSNEDIEAAGREDGTTGILNREIVGDNAEPHFPSQLTAEHGAARHVIGHAMRATVQAIAATLSMLLPAIKVEREQAFSAIDSHKSALKKQIVTKAEFAASGVTISPVQRRWVVALMLIALFAGDWTLIAVGFQLFGLSDHPWIPGVGFFDDLHIAAISSVVALVLLGGRAGVRLGRIEYDLHRRGKTAKDERDALPRHPWHDWAFLVLWFGTALAALLALAAIRSEYLTQNGIDANGAAFIALQLAIFGAAIAVGHAHAPHPEVEMWRARLAEVDTTVTETGDEQQATLDAYSASIGRYNAEVRHLKSEVAQSGHHVGTDGQSVLSQQYAYLRRYILSQPGDQIATESILASEFDEIAEDTKSELLEFLTGVTPLPEFKLLTTQSLEQALANARAEVSRLRSRVDLKSIKALDLPEFEEAEGEPVDRDEAGADADLVDVDVDVDEESESPDPDEEQDGEAAELPKVRRFRQRSAATEEPDVERVASEAESA
ncbi:hypothetical protein SAMN05892883_2802 [Jatrophihabitans sp. GAS493]|uniref:hypothetical protein n=1 Tax=Jatrophihabitans sp. GAS493 TaxID=1907575 RepID=UPI000BBF6E62|nr:hypothetical protein [Jatrophihabitans sp. GAS493]SOD73509.1 hypothetical protein SAMN05892883_2802 [Jatrophihabitans sp. GAS493]